MLDLQELSMRQNAYTLGKFCPVYVGGLFNDRYLVLRKLGYGVSSTVWLVVHIYHKNYYAMKVTSAELWQKNGDILEMRILEYLKEGDYPEKEFTLQLVDRFAVLSRNGRHVSLVFHLTGADDGGFFSSFGRANTSRVFKTICQTGVAGA